MNDAVVIFDETKRDDNFVQNRINESFLMCDLGREETASKYYLEDAIGLIRKVNQRYGPTRRLAYKFVD